MYVCMYMFVCIVNMYAYVNIKFLFWELVFYLLKIQIDFKKIASTAAVATAIALVNVTGI